MTVDVLPEAREELRDAGIYFDSLRPSRYDAFMAEWNAGVARIVAAPRLHSPADDAPPGVEVRHYILPRFQRRIVYMLTGDAIVILALAHTRRKPGYWHNRLPGNP